MDTPHAIDKPAVDTLRPGPAPGPGQSPGAMIDSTALLQGGRAVTINHNGELYRLQATRQGKLILTK
jgi:hemin uptake protein HemP